MEWDDLKYFLAVSRDGSLTVAARSLKTSASTVARRIGTLEKRLGARLFDRKQSGYKLTESGEAIRLKAEEVEEAVLSVEREAVGRDLRPTGKVRIAASDDVGTHIISPNLARFRRRYPDISLEIVAQMDLANLTRREADIALRGQRPAHGDFVVHSAGYWPFGLYAGRSYAKSHGLKPGLSDLSKAEIITWTEEHAHVRGGPWFAQHARGSAVALASDSARVHYAACKAGIGVAILPSNLADRERDLICLLPTERVLSVELWVVVHRDLIRTARVRAVMEFLVGLAPRRPPMQSSNCIRE
jgi:DNA-binding transcriptional LysR family regulator